MRSYSPLKGKVNFPTSANDMPRSGGIASMMRLPIQSTIQGLDVCFVGIPLDTGTSNRSGTRYVRTGIKLDGRKQQKHIKTIVNYLSDPARIRFIRC